MTVEWRPVPGYPDYRVSSEGQVWSRFRGGRMLSPAPGKWGYWHLNLSRDKTPHTFAIHRLVALTFLGPCPPGLQVRHLDGVKANNNLENLVYGTPSENMTDRVKHGQNHNAEKTHCLRGHEFSPENTSVGQGQRYCKACKRAKEQRARSARRLTKAAAA